MEGILSRGEIEILKAELPTLFDEQGPRRILERDARTVHSVYGLHQTNQTFEPLTRHPKLLEPTQQIIGNTVYVYQFKINAKAAFSGDAWEWHQDYIFWQREDGLPEAQLVNVTVFLDGVEENNGPF